MPTIGGGSDILWIDPRCGVEKLQYAEHKDVGFRRVAQLSNHHQISHLCICGKETAFQIDFKEDMPLGPGLERVPDNLEFECTACGAEQSLKDVTEFLGNLLSGNGQLEELET